ncbi:MAG: ACT domain-containing protein [Acidimicrobiales bacterium]
MPRFSLFLLGTDGPGIVATLSGALESHGCNLEDSTATVLQDHFALMVVVTAPDGTTAASLEEAIESTVKRHDLVVSIKEFHESVPAMDPSGSYEALVISVHGSDQPGIVHAISEVLARGGANIVELSTQLVGDPEDPVYVMNIRALAPEGTRDAVAVEVDRASEELGVHCYMRRDDADTF